MYEATKVSGDHHIAKITMWPQLIDPAAMPEYTEGAPRKRDRLTFAEQSGRNSFTA
jgi:hypothetical protein